MKAKFEQLPLFDLEKYSRNYKALQARTLEHIDIDSLQGMYPRELKPLCAKFGLKLWGKSDELIRRIKSARRSYLEKKICRGN
jgi:hypothetical protein